MEWRERNAQKKAMYVQLLFCLCLCVRQIFAAVYCNTDLLMPWWLRYFGLVIRMRFSHSLFVLDSGKRALGAVPNTYFYLSVVLLVRLTLKDRKNNTALTFEPFLILSGCLYNTLFKTICKLCICTLTVLK